MTVFDGHTNLAISLVATAPSPATTGTSLVVTASDGALFPAADGAGTDEFNAVIWPADETPTRDNAEIVRVTEVATDTLTIVRDQEEAWGARTVIIGDQIACVPSALNFTDIEDAINLRVVGPGTISDDAIVTFNGTTGLAIQDSGVSISTDDTLATDSDALIPTEQAVKAYVDGNVFSVTGTATDTYVVASNSGTPTWTPSGGGIGAVIDDQVLASTASTITFSSIPGTYAGLVLSYQCRGDAAATNRALSLQFNGDTGNNYNTQYLQGANTTASASAVDGTSPALIGYFAAASASAGYAGDGTLELFNYAGTTFFKTAMFTASREENGAAANRRHWRGHITWESTAAITQITLIPQSDNFIAGSRFTLYGISGA